jgi:thioredoxin-related protein
MRNAIGFFLVFIGLCSFTVQAQEINWMSFEEAIEAQKKNKKKIFVDIYTDWCGWCKRMDQTTFSNPTIADYVNDKFYAVKFDAEQKQAIEFKGDSYKHVHGKRRPYHELAAHLAKNRLSYPTIVFLNEKGEVIQPIAGYQDPENFEMLMTFYGENHYKEIPWGQYKSTFQSKLN